MLGIAPFLASHEDTFPSVGVFTAKRKLVIEIQGAMPADNYEFAIKKALATK